MSQVDQGAAASAIEGPPSFMPPPAYGSPTADPHSDARLDQLTQAFGGPHQPTSAPLSIEDSHQQSSAMDQPQASSSWGKTLFKPFDWTSQHPQPGKEIMTADKTSEDNPMRYKRRSRRVSLMTSEGAAIFQFDVPNTDSSAANNSTTTTFTNNNIIASAPPSSGEQSRPQFSQFVQGSSSDVSIDPPETVGPSSGLIVNRRGRRSSLSEIVEQENIKAGQDPEKLPVIVETTVDLLQQTNSAEDPAKRKKKSSVFNSWFFRSPDYNPDESDSAQTTAPPTPESRKTSTSSNPNLEGIGGGQLTSKVVDALGIKSPSRKESRQMNVWMPQGM